VAGPISREKCEAGEPGAGEPHLVIFSGTAPSRAAGRNLPEGRDPYFNLHGHALLTPGAKTYPGATFQNPFGTGVHFRNPSKERRLSSPKGTSVPNATGVHPGYTPRANSPHLARPVGRVSRPVRPARGSRPPIRAGKFHSPLRPKTQKGPRGSLVTRASLGRHSVVSTPGCRDHTSASFFPVRIFWAGSLSSSFFRLGAGVRSSA